MSKLMIIITNISIFILLILSIYYYVRSRNKVILFVNLTILVFYYLFLYYYFFFAVEVPIARGNEVPIARRNEVPIARGNAENDIYFVVILYVFMLLGMLSQYLYAWIGQPKRYKKKFDFGMFIAPIFTSPIIFIPLLSALQNTGDLGKLTTIAKIMIFLVAFENGFFWKEYFDNRQKVLTSAKEQE